MPTITTLPQKLTTAEEQLVSLFDNTDAPSISSKPSSVKILSTSQPSTSPQPSGSMILITASPSISPAPISYSKVTGCSSQKYPYFISNDKLCTFNSRDHWKQ